MKNSKRILGVALALIMIFNVFAVGTFAAFPDDAVVKLALRSDKATYAQGEEITLTFSEQVIADIGTMRIGGQYDIGYNSSIFELVSTATTETNALEAHGFAAIQAGYDGGISAVQIPSSAGVSDINGWDTAVTWNVGDDGATTFAATEMTDLFTVKLKVKADAPNGTYTIGFNPAGYEGYNAYSNDGIGLGGLYGASGTDYGFAQANMYEYGTVEITVGAAAEKEVKHADTMAQWADKDAGKINVGLVGKFLTEDIAIEYNGSRLTNVEKVGAKVTINGTEVEGYTDYVYDVNGDGSELWFRAVVEGVDYNATGAAGDISVVYVVEMTDGTTYESIAYTTTVAEVYAEACGNGMPAFGA